MARHETELHRQRRELLAAMEEIRTRSAGADVEGLEHGCERTVLATIHAIASRAIAAALANPVKSDAERLLEYRQQLEALKARVAKVKAGTGSIKQEDGQ